jgi:hypothetical protein
VAESRRKSNADFAIVGSPAIRGEEPVVETAVLLEWIERRFPTGWGDYPT